MTDGVTINSQNRHTKKNSVKGLKTRNNSVKMNKRQGHNEQLVVNPFEMEQHRNT